MNIKEIIIIDIIDDILVRTDALTIYLGKEVNDYLLEKFDSLTEPSLIEIDFRKANPIDYLFINAAFGEFYKKVTASKIIDVVFYIEKAHEKSFFLGLLACLDGNIHRSGNFKQDFESANFIKICLKGNELEFVGNISDPEKEILNYVNAKESTSADEVYENFKTKFTLDVISDATRGVVDKKFIYSIEGSMPQKIYSIKPKII